jgi:hypothetical protein
VVFRGHEPDGFEPIVRADNDEGGPRSDCRLVAEPADRTGQVRDELDHELLGVATEFTDLNFDAAKLVDGAEHGGGVEGGRVLIIYPVQSVVSTNNSVDV